MVRGFGNGRKERYWSVLVLGSRMGVTWVVRAHLPRVLGVVEVGFDAY